MLPLPASIPPTVGTLHRCRAQCIDTATGLAALRAPWDELLLASAAESPFLTWEWLHTWWTHLRGRAVLRTMAVWAGPELVAVVPLVRRRGSFGWLHRDEFLGIGEAGSDYLDLIVRAGREGDAVRAIADSLVTSGVPLLLDHVPQPSLSARLAAALEASGWTAVLTPGGVCPVIRLAGHSWDSYLATLGSAHRANIRRRLRGLGQRFRMRFDQVTTDAQRRDALDALCRFHQHRFQARGGSTAFHAPELRAFHDEATRLALERGWLRMYTLVLDRTVAAVMYGFAYSRQFYFYQHGFDDRYERHSLGLVLMALTIRAAIDERMQAFDLLWGTEGYKRLWTSEDRRLQRIHLFPGTTAGRIRRRLTGARRRLGPLARRMLNAEACHGQ